MNMKLLNKKILAAALAVITAVPMMGADFIDTSKSANLLTLGARVGVNTSNRTMSSDVYPGCYHRESWGAGFDFGAVATLNILDCFAVQPGLFFEGRYSYYTLMSDPVLSQIVPGGYWTAQAGDLDTYNFTIPVMAMFRMNVARNVRWNIEAGPYFTVVLGSSLKTRQIVSQGELNLPLPMTKPSTCDFGFKFGTSLNVRRNWNVGVHYLAGCVHAWKAYETGSLSKPFGGVTKEWLFTVGYDF